MSENESPDQQFGRVADDGTVYVITSTGERAVGQVPDVTPEEAMAFFERRFEWLEGHVTLLKQRVDANNVSAEEARKQIATLTEQISTANAVGDLEGLQRILDSLAPRLEEMSAVRKAQRAAQNEETKAAKEKMISEADKIAGGKDWRGGHGRFRELLDQWKALPRIDRATDDELWHRFSAARSSYDKARKVVMAEQGAQRDSAKKAKQAIIEEARGLATSTDWGPATGGFRDLMARWKAAGSAPRDIDEKLWQEFRGLQDQFFSAKSGVLAEQDAEFKGNLEAKEALLAAAEADIVPVSDLTVAKKKLQSFLDEFNRLGKVPRDSIRPMDQRVRALTQAVADAEKAEWHRTDPEARQRAEDAVTMFADRIARLEEDKTRYEAKGDAKKAADAQNSITFYLPFLEQAKATLADFLR